MEMGKITRRCHGIATFLVLLLLRSGDIVSAAAVLVLTHFTTHPRVVVVVVVSVVRSYGYLFQQPAWFLRRKGVTHFRYPLL